MNQYHVKKLDQRKEIKVQVPGSKSITNRALLLAALSAHRCVLHGVLFSDDSRAFLDSLVKLGFEVEADEETKDVVIQGLCWQRNSPPALPFPGRGPRC